MAKSQGAEKFVAIIEDYMKSLDEIKKSLKKKRAEYQNMINGIELVETFKEFSGPKFIKFVRHSRDALSQDSSLSFWQELLWGNFLRSLDDGVVSWAYEKVTVQEINQLFDAYIEAKGGEDIVLKE